MRLSEFNPAPYTIAAGIGGAEGYHLAHKKDKRGQYTSGTLGSLLGTLGGPLGVHAGKKQVKDITDISKALAREWGLSKGAALDSLSPKKLPKITDSTRGLSTAQAISGVGSGTISGIAGYLASKSLTEKPPLRALAAGAAAVGGDVAGNMIYRKIIEGRLEDSDNRYLRRLAQEKN